MEVVSVPDYDYDHDSELQGRLGASHYPPKTSAGILPTRLPRWRHSQTSPSRITKKVGRTMIKTVNSDVP